MVLFFFFIKYKYHFKRLSKKLIKYFNFRPTEDSFNSQVTVDIGSTYPHENEIRQILEDQLHFHALGNIQIEPTGFTFRSIQGNSIIALH